MLSLNIIYMIVLYNSRKDTDRYFDNYASDRRDHIGRSSDDDLLEIDDDDQYPGSPHSNQLSYQQQSQQQQQRQHLYRQNFLNHQQSVAAVTNYSFPLFEFKYCTHLKASTFSRLVYINSIDRVPNPESVGEDELISSIIDQEAQRVYQYVLKVYPKVLAKVGNKVLH